MVFIRKFFLIAFFCASSFSFAEPLESSNAVALTSEYLPLSPGNTWRYRVNEINPTTVKENTHTVQQQTYNINGVEAVALTSSATAEEPVHTYYTNDSNGLRLHGGTFPDENFQSVEGRFIPPLTYLGPQLIIGQTQTSSGTVESDNIKPEDQLTMKYTYTSTVLGTETVTVPAGTFATIKTQYQMNIQILHQGVVVYEWYDIDTSWFAKNVGIVKGISEDENGFVDSSELLSTSITPPTSLNPKTDFDGDGKSDILWRHNNIGMNYLYLMDGSAIANHAVINTVTDLNWKIQGTGDFDADGKADVLWRNTTTGQNYLYMMDSNSLSNHGAINTLADLNWEINGIDDFNNDGRADILWRNVTTGQNYLFFMNANTVIDAGSVNTLADLNWEIKGTGDFNGDGFADILWRNISTGGNYIFFMNSNTVIDSGAINTVADQNWTIKGVDDFNSDGRDDILWRNTATGQNYLYMMDGTTLNDHGAINTLADVNWEVKSTGDYNGDSKADILWRNNNTGGNYIFFMNANIVIDAGAINTVSDQNWVIQ